LAPNVGTNRTRARISSRSVARGVQKQRLRSAPYFDELFDRLEFAVELGGRDRSRCDDDKRNARGNQHEHNHCSADLTARTPKMSPPLALEIQATACSEAMALVTICSWMQLRRPIKPLRSALLLPWKSDVLPEFIGMHTRGAGYFAVGARFLKSTSDAAAR
jgi:hypothetical protein